MKEDKIAVCRLCLNLTESGNFDFLDEVKAEMLAIVLPELNLAITSDPVICKCCSENLQRSYDFKTEYLHYYQNVEIEINNREYRKKCVFCCRINKELFCVKEDILLKEMLDKCLPQVEVMENIAVCESCLEPLQNQYNFVIKCLDVEEKIATYSTKSARNTKVNLFGIFEAEGLKRIETIDLQGDATIKKEGTDFSVVNQTKDIKMECIDNIESEIEGNEGIKKEGTEINATKDVKIECVNIKSENAIKEEDVDIKPEKEPEEETQVLGGKKVYKCDQCDYQTFRKTDLTLRHILRHKKPEELKMYKCTECSYQSKRSGDLNSHLAIHADSVPVYRCDNCRYKTIHKSRLKEHVLKHNVPGKYKCEFCSYSASYKKTFMQHVKSHRRPKKKLIHKCELCPYETRRRTDLTDKHMLIHRTPDELVMHKCAHCDFQAKHKSSLNRHMVKHLHPQSDPISYSCPQPTEESNIFKCHLCPYETKVKSYLTRHVLTHKKKDKLKRFCCDICNYETDKKVYYARHLTKHNTEQINCAVSQN